MAVPTHFKFTARGRFDQTDEAWSFGFHMTRAVAELPDAGISDIDQSGVTAAFAACLGSSATASNVKMDDWRAYVIGTDGRMQGEPLVVDVSGDSIGGAGSLKFPPQVALVATLVANNRGPARFGRLYLPGPSYALSTDSRLTEAIADEAAETVTTLLKAVADSIDLASAGQATALNISSVGAGGAGTRQTVDHVEVGRVYDTLRSRRRSMAEDRVIHGHIDW